MKLNVLTWNLENLFHPTTGGPRNDYTEKEGWTVDKFIRKTERIGKALNQIIQGTNWNPFVFCFTEVENPLVLQEVLRFLPPQYKIAVDPEFKPSYHDVLFVYDSKMIDLIKVTTHKTFIRFDKGDVVQADFKVKGVDKELTFFGCHLKARPSSVCYTAMFRQAVCDNLQSLIWRMHGGDKLMDQVLKLKNPEFNPEIVLDKNIIVLGDFNDEPFSSSLIDYLGATYDKFYVKALKSYKKVALYNCSWEAMNRPKPGSYYYPNAPSSQWTMLDQIIISPHLLTENSQLQYVDQSFKVVENVSATESGVPYATCKTDENDNIIWQEGYSDHFPVMIELVGP